MLKLVRGKGGSGFMWQRHWSGSHASLTVTGLNVTTSMVTSLLKPALSPAVKAKILTKRWHVFVIFLDLDTYSILLSAPGALLEIPLSQRKMRFLTTKKTYFKSIELWYYIYVRMVIGLFSFHCLCMQPQFVLSCFCFTPANFSIHRTSWHFLDLVSCPSYALCDLIYHTFLSLTWPLCRLPLLILWPILQSRISWLCIWISVPSHSVQTLKIHLAFPCQVILQILSLRWINNCLMLWCWMHYQKTTNIEEGATV